ncbi:hypothetical protein SAMN04488056_1232 [Cohaesibacter marisflavi]|uniref:Uncharacterized protein n=1 Tax=Cohaesibacter marisflavi TaxID=655353 RepID=A0A1I5MQZ9_9HYPH|nr:hypothetical protein [Cohaesibacter marisflavi]SFP11959.1 hypothetical protein SAMN04488056_1232 [Cohaesibacter marisflavi]
MMIAAKLLEIHGLKYASDGKAIIADTTQDFGAGQIRCDFVYRDGSQQTSPVYDAVRDFIASGVMEIDPPTPSEIIEEELFPLTPRQLRLVLSRNDYLVLVEPALEAIEDQQAREEALIEWGYATQYDPGNPLIEQLRLALGISEGEMGAMWRTAQAL